jgi:transcriptional adapter 2-alpha
MLEGIERFGVGNWEKIAKHIGSKSAVAVERHYNIDYMGIHGHIIPGMMMQGSKSEQIPSPEFINRHKDRLPAPPSLPFEDEIERGTEVTRERSARPLSSLSMNPSVFQDLSERIAKLPGGTLAGYMPLRKDFELDSYHQAEEVLAPLTFEDDDTPEETVFKLRALQGYNRIMDLRKAREDFAISRNLVDCKRVGGFERRRKRDERTVAARLAPFAQFQTKDEHTWLVDSVTKLSRMKTHLARIASFRRMGLRTSGEAFRFMETMEQFAKQEDKKLHQSKFEEITPPTPPVLNPFGDGSHNPYLSSSSLTSSSSSSSSKPRAGLLKSHERVEQGDEKVDFKLEEMEMVEHLDEEEKELCRKALLPPSLFLAIKSELLLPRLASAEEVEAERKKRRGSRGQERKQHGDVNEAKTNLEGGKGDQSSLKLKRSRGEEEEEEVPSAGDPWVLRKRPRLQLGPSFRVFDAAVFQRHFLGSDKTYNGDPVELKRLLAGMKKKMEQGSLVLDGDGKEEEEEET